MVKRVALRLSFAAACVVVCLDYSTALAVDPAVTWNEAFLRAARRDNTPSALMARNLALLHLAIARALIPAGDGQPTGGSLPPAPAANADVLAAVYSACEVATSLYPGQHADFECLCDAQCAEFQPAGELVAVSHRRGQEIARRTLEYRCGDGSATNLTYIPKKAAGQWRRTPPFFRPPELPQCGTLVKPLVLERADQFRPPGPPPLTSKRYAEAFREVVALGRRDSDTRTTEQTLIARFWSDFSYTEMPVGHWNSITRSIVQSRHLQPTESARLFALLNLALADAGVATWDAKYHYNAWRPVTAISRADENNNPDTLSDNGWLPLLNTPPHPEYPSGHSSFSGAAASILTHFFGTDAVPFDVHSDTLPEQQRHFESLRTCALECENSRIYGGIHFRFSGDDGLFLGHQIGDLVWDRTSQEGLWHVLREDHKSF